MDERPFLEIDLLNPDSINVKELRNFTKATFDQDALLANARDLKYLREIKRVLESDWSEPSEEFVRYLMAQSSSGLRTKQRLEQFTRLAKDATQEFLTAKVNDRQRRRYMVGPPLRTHRPHSLKKQWNLKRMRSKLRLKSGRHSMP